MEVLQSYVMVNFNFRMLNWEYFKFLKQPTIFVIGPAHVVIARENQANSL
jgi:hypothetical protein